MKLKYEQIPLKWALIQCLEKNNILVPKFNTIEELQKICEQYIPKGVYCYKNHYYCPFLDRNKQKHEHESGYCHFIQKGDWMEDGTLLLWDLCKECGINDDYE